MTPVIKMAAAYRDLDGHAAFLQQSSPHVAIRFLDSVDQSCGFLAGMPEIGGLWETTNPRYVGMRWWATRGFENYLIFYRPTVDGIEVIRVLHAARNIASIFGD